MREGGRGPPRGHGGEEGVGGGSEPSAHACTRSDPDRSLHGSSRGPARLQRRHEPSSAAPAPPVGPPPQARSPPGGALPGVFQTVQVSCGLRDPCSLRCWKELNPL